ncbi:hypothetical protein ACFSFY_05355 [Sporosarcina siberiensis]|uniref:Lipoprotein n=1 Tax=Sporosarcina siberiensis TaxID=1365606 RepID=A0ABW4SFT5_9BACL
MIKGKLIILFVAIIVLVLGCTLKTQKITIQKRIGDENVFEDYREVTQGKQVKKVKEILDNADWENNKVEMTEFHDFEFQFPFKNDKNAKIASYSFWIIPNGGNLEIVTDNDRYAKLTKQDSTYLYKVLVGDIFEK